MTLHQTVSDKAYVNRALEASIHIGLAILLAATCLLILLPFIPVSRQNVVHLQNE